MLENPIVLSAHLLSITVAVGSYFYRIAESSTNSTANIYYWDALWFVVDTMTGLPVADDAIEPKGQFGRVIAVFVRFMGILWYAMLIQAARYYIVCVRDSCLFSMLI